MTTTRKSFTMDSSVVAVGFVMGSAVLAMLSNTWGALPVIEGWVSAVVSIRVPPKQIWRDSQRTCFVLSEVKESAAVPVTYEFQARSRLSAWVQVPVKLVGPNREPLDSDHLDNHAVGQRWDRGYCFGSAIFPAEDELIVRGMATHDRHPLWLTQTLIQPFDVKPVSSAKP